MRFLSVAALAVCLPLASSHNILLRAHSRECFHEELHRDDKMTVTFQVGDREDGGSGNLDIDFYVGSAASLNCETDTALGSNSLRRLPHPRCQRVVWRLFV